MVGPISHNWIGDKLRCQSPIIITPQMEDPQYLWAWVAVQTVLHSPPAGRRKQTNMGEAAPFAGVVWPRLCCTVLCSRGLFCCFWSVVPGFFYYSFGPADTRMEHPSQVEEAHFFFTVGICVIPKASIKLVLGFRLLLSPSVLCGKSAG